MSTHQDDPVPPMPSNRELAVRAGQKLSEREQILAELEYTQLLKDVKHLMEQDKDTIKWSIFKPYKPALAALVLAFLTAIGTSAWDYLKGFHHTP